LSGADEEDALQIPQGRDVPGGRLYRYRAFDATELRLLLVSGQIRFANPAYFNDPWDCRPRFEAERPGNEADRQRIIKEVIGITTSANPDAPPEVLARLADELFRDHSALQRFYEGTDENTIRLIRAKYRVLCLSNSGAVPVMWSHYAKSHRGICLIFDAVDPIIGDAYQVQYSQDYPAIVLPTEPGSKMIEKSLLTKPIDWKHEGEYRVLAREYGPGDDDNPWRRSHQGFVDFAQSALVGVILGAFMEPNDEAWARALLKAAPHPVERWHAQLERSCYALRLEPEA